MALYALGELAPTIDPSAFVHPDAVVIGNVHIGAGHPSGLRRFYAETTGPSASVRRPRFKTARLSTAPLSWTPWSAIAAWLVTTLISKAAPCMTIP